MTTRRTFLKGLTATAAGLLVPSAGLADAAEVRRFWQLDKTMTGGSLSDFHRYAVMMDAVWESAFDQDQRLVVHPDTAATLASLLRRGGDTWWNPGYETALRGAVVSPLVRLDAIYFCNDERAVAADLAAFHAPAAPNAASSRSARSRRMPSSGCP